MSVFEKALAVGLKAGLRAGRTSLTYTPAASPASPIALYGVQGKKLWKIQKPGKPIVMVTSVDFLIEVADLVVDGSLIIPERDDTITRRMSSFDLIYRILPLDNSIPLFSYCDTGQTVYRIHTKFDKKEAV